jgi:hypothetical protein
MHRSVDPRAKLADGPNDLFLKVHAGLLRIMSATAIGPRSNSHPPALLTIKGPMKIKKLHLWVPYLSLIALSGMGAKATDLSQHETWDKFSLSLGGFLADTQSDVRVGTGLGLDLNVEDTLGLKNKTVVGRAETYWRFTQNRRHRLDASWFAFRRSATRTVGQDFVIKDQEGNPVTIQAGTNIDTKFNLDIIETAYSYSFLQDERLDLAGSFGIYVMPINFGLTATGLTNASGRMKFTAPLPVVGLRMDVALTPKWYLRTGSQLFEIKYQNFSGRLAQMHTAVEYLPFRHFGMGLGFDSMRFLFQGTKEGKRDVDIRGDVNFQYTGIQLYGKFFF